MFSESCGIYMFCQCGCGADVERTDVVFCDDVGTESTRQLETHPHTPLLTLHNNSAVVFHFIGTKAESTFKCATYLRGFKTLALLSHDPHQYMDFSTGQLDIEGRCLKRLYNKLHAPLVTQAFTIHLLLLFPKIPLLPPAMRTPCRLSVQ